MEDMHLLFSGAWKTLEHNSSMTDIAEVSQDKFMPQNALHMLGIRSRALNYGASPPMPTHGFVIKYNFIVELTLTGRKDDFNNH